MSRIGFAGQTSAYQDDNNRGYVGADSTYGGVLNNAHYVPPEGREYKSYIAGTHVIKDERTGAGINAVDTLLDDEVISNQKDGVMPVLVTGIEQDISSRVPTRAGSMPHAKGTYLRLVLGFMFPDTNEATTMIGVTNAVICQRQEEPGGRRNAYGEAPGNPGSTNGNYGVDYRQIGMPVATYDWFVEQAAEIGLKLTPGTRVTFNHGMAWMNANIERNVNPYATEVKPDDRSEDGYKIIEHNTQSDNLRTWMNRHIKQGQHLKGTGAFEFTAKRHENFNTTGEYYLYPALVGVQVSEATTVCPPPYKPVSGFRVNLSLMSKVNATSMAAGGAARRTGAAASSGSSTNDRDDRNTNDRRGDRDDGGRGSTSGSSNRRDTSDRDGGRDDGRRERDDRDNRAARDHGRGTSPGRGSDRSRDGGRGNDQRSDRDRGDRRSDTRDQDRSSDSRSGSSRSGQDSYRASASASSSTRHGGSGDDRDNRRRDDGSRRDRDDDDRSRGSARSQRNDERKDDREYRPRHDDDRSDRRTRSPNRNRDNRGRDDDRRQSRADASDKAAAEPASETQELIETIDQLANPVVTDGDAPDISQMRIGGTDNPAVNAPREGTRAADAPAAGADDGGEE